MSRALRFIARASWGVYAWTLFVIIALVATLGVLILPGLERRRRFARRVARLWFALIGCPPVVDGASLPIAPCVVVANHASYIDGVLLTAVLPADFSFVIKREMAAVPLAGLLLSRIGSQFVDRDNRHMGGLAIRRLLRAAADGEALVFFPEGTFKARPGLRRFHAGAFVAALRGRLPVWPVAIHGTRDMLSAGRLLPSPGALRVSILAPIAPDPAADSIDTLRGRSREHLLAVLHEPDLPG